MMSILYLLPVLLHHGLSAPRLTDKEICILDNGKLHYKITVLQDRLRLGDLLLQDLINNNYHSVKSNVFKSNIDRRKTVIQVPPTSGNLIVHDEDCSSVFERGKRESGYYRIQPTPENEPFLVYCDMTDGGGWTVIQRRSNGRVNFNKKWDDYKQGFGSFKGKNDEHWLGNNHIYSLLDKREMSLQIDLMDWKGNKRYAIYEEFRTGNEQDNYKLWVGYYSGTAGDGLSGGSNFENQWSASLKGMPFSTSDKDNDRFIHGNCAQENKCGWWFNRCHIANLNGVYYKNGNYTGEYDNGIVWSTWRGLWYSLKHVSMKIRRPTFLDVGSGTGING
ncbi:fibrinogen-like protein 1 [Pelobates fuscus]|uniref:fibrinogen-like protein 1 n=1 Tax=Pelobates fuscus TaxID=191477 RepID=UPI002FE46045